MAKRQPKTQGEARRPKNLPAGQRSNSSRGKTILTHSVGALPILNRLLKRMRLPEFLGRHLPPEDNRTKVDAPRVVLLLLRNLLVSREPMYGVAEWARNFGPELFDLWPEDLKHLNDDGSLRDVFRVCTDEQVSKEGFRLLWFHSRSKAETDGETRARRLQRAIRELTDLRQRLSGPRTRFRQREKVALAVEKILDAHAAGDFLHVDIQERQQEKYRQAGRGRPHSGTKYTRSVRMQFDLTWEVDGQQLDRAVAGDGVFPLITNITHWKAADVLKAYKRQPIIEKRFSQLKTDFCVAPVYLKSVTRIVGLLAIYFFALMVQSLLERELRQAMAEQGVESIPIYPEGRPCKRPTTRRVLDVFEPIARHTISTAGSDDAELFTTELAPIHRTILKLLRVPAADYRP